MISHPSVVLSCSKLESHTHTQHTTHIDSRILLYILLHILLHILHIYLTQTYLHRSLKQTMRKYRKKIVACGHTTDNAPDPIRTPQLNSVGPAQYWGGGPPGNSVVLQAFFFFFFFTRKTRNGRVFKHNFFFLNSYKD